MAAGDALADGSGLSDGLGEALADGDALVGDGFGFAEADADDFAFGVSDSLLFAFFALSPWSGLPQRLCAASRTLEGSADFAAFT